MGIVTKRRLLLLLLLAFAAAAAVCWPRAPLDAQQDIGVKFSQAPVRTDIEPISNELPWLQIVACQWKEVVMGGGGVPGPSDVIVCGYITVPDESLEELRASYEWYECNVVVHMLPEGVEESDLALQMSAEYDSENILLQNGSNIGLYVDFGLKLIYFSGSI